MTAEAVRRIDNEHLPRLDLTHTPLRVDIGHPRPDVATLEVFGEVDRATVPLLIACLENVGRPGLRTVVVGLAHVSFLGVCGLEALYDAREDLELIGATLCLASASKGVWRVLSLADLAPVFPVYTTLNDAVDRSPSSSVA